MLQAQIYIDKDEMYDDNLLYTVIMEVLIKNDMNGATAIDGFMGFGANQKMKNPNQLFSFDEVPMIITFIDEDEKVKNVIKEIRKLGTNGTIVTHHVDVY